MTTDGRILDKRGDAAVSLYDEHTILKGYAARKVSTADTFIHI